MRKGLLIRDIQKYFNPTPKDRIIITSDSELTYDILRGVDEIVHIYSFYIRIGDISWDGEFSTFNEMDAHIRKHILKQSGCPDGVDALLEKGGM